MGTKSVSAPRGTNHILSTGGKDDSSHKVGMGKELGGSMTNLSHSLEGASAVQSPHPKGKKAGVD